MKAASERLHWSEASTRIVLLTLETCWCRFPCPNAVISGLRMGDEGAENG